MTIKEQLLAKVQVIKNSTEAIMKGGEPNEQIVADASTDQAEPKESI